MQARGERKTWQKYFVRGVGTLSGVGIDGDDDHDVEEEDNDGDDDDIEDDDDDGDDGDDDGEHGQNNL